MPYKSDIEQRVEALEKLISSGAGAFGARITALESKLGIVNNGVSGLNQRMVELEAKASQAEGAGSGLADPYKLIDARLLQLENKVFQAAGDGPVQTTRQADPTLNPVTLPVSSPAPPNDGSAPAPESEGGK